MMQSINIVRREFKNARLQEVLENIFEPHTDWPRDSPRIRRGVQNKMLEPTRPLTTSWKGILERGIEQKCYQKPEN